MTHSFLLRRFAADRNHRRISEISGQVNRISTIEERYPIDAVALTQHRESGLECDIRSNNQRHTL